MKAVIKLVFISVLLLMAESAKSQPEQSNWHFGTTTKGLHFSPAGTVSVTNTSYTPHGAEGCGVLSDPVTGALRFYTDGVVVVDATHTPMPNGSGLNGYSTSEGTGRIVADPNNCNRFYIFHNTSAFEIGAATEILYYSVVDITLPGNGTIASPLGDVVPGLKNIVVASSNGMMEGFEVVPIPNTHNYWLLITKYGSPATMLIYKFTTTGITLNSTYTFTTAMQDVRTIQYCPLNNKIAVGSMVDYDKTLILDFNPVTGTVTGSFNIPGLPAGTNGIYYGIYDVAWSPDGTKLYISKYRLGTTGGKLYQYNLSTSTTTLIYNVSAVSNTFSGKGLQMGPDGKMYYLYTNAGGGLVYIGAIASPNSAGLACAFNPLEINMGSDLGSTHKFPKFLTSNNIIRHANDTTYAIARSCSVPSDTFSLSISRPLLDTDGDHLSYQVTSVASPTGSASYNGTGNIQYVNNGTFPLSDTITIRYCDDYCTSKCDSFNVYIHITSLAAPVVELGNDTTVCASVVLHLNQTFASVLWSTGSTNAADTVYLPGHYYVDVTDSNGCTASDSIDITINPLPFLYAGSDTGLCGNTNVILSTNQNFPNIAWSNGAGTQTTVVSTPGLYYVSVTDNNGCVSRDSVNVVAYVLPVVDLGNDTSLCGPLVLNTGQPFPLISWSTGNTTQLDTITLPGAYYVHITDVHGCSASDSINVLVHPVPAIFAGNDTSLCGIFSLTLTADHTYPGMLWNTGASTQTITAASSGLYYLTVTDSAGCSNTDSVNVAFHALPTVNAGNDTTACGNLTIQLNQPFPVILWSTGSTLQSDTVSATGTYFVAVTDINGCTGSDSIHVIVHPVPFLSAGNDSVICGNTPLTLSTNQAFPGILWSNGATTQSTSVNTTGIYYVHVSDANGCSNDDSVTVTFHPLPLVDLGNDTSSCGNLVLTVNQPFPSVLWNTGAITQSYTATASGLYYVNILDANGCPGSDSVLVTINPAAIVNLGGPYAFCSNVAISQLLYVSSAQSVLWSTGETSDSIFVNTPGTYSVAVSNSGGCNAADTTVISSLPAPVASLPAAYTGCPFRFEAGTAAAYLWSTGETSPSVLLQQSGTYSVVLTAANGCTASASITVSIDGYDPDYLSHLPNVFTPNGDDVNDNFNLHSVFNSCTKFKSITIYNRWGQVMFESEDPDFEWNGKIHGDDVPEGVYFGILESGPEDDLSKTAIHITLLR